MQCHVSSSVSIASALGIIATPADHSRQRRPPYDSSQILPLTHPLNSLMASHLPPLAYKDLPDLFPCFPPQSLGSLLRWEYIKPTPATGLCHSMLPVPGGSEFHLLGSVVVSFWSQPKCHHLRVGFPELLSKGVLCAPIPVFLV